MEQEFTRQETIRQYLLGNLSEPELSAIERELFFNEELSRTADLIEDEIIEQYLDQELDPREQKAVETHFLRPPARREKLNLVRMVRQRAESPARPDRPLPPWNFLAWLKTYSTPVTAVVCMIPITYLGIALYHARIENKALAAKVQAAKNPPIASKTVVMQYGMARGHNSLRNISISPTESKIPFDLMLPSRFAESFDIRLWDCTHDPACAHDPAQEIWSKPGVPAAQGQPRVIFEMPTQGIRTGTYDLVVSDPANNALSVTYPFDATVSQTP